MERELQAVIMVVGFVVLVILLRSVTKTFRTSVRKRRVHVTEARRHFVKAATLISEAKNGKVSDGEARFLAGTAVNEADIAIEMDPNDAAVHIVKSLALEHLGKSAEAVQVLGIALSQQMSKSLSMNERADTLAKRAELLLTQGGGVDEALMDLQESVKLSSKNPRLYLMLGSCYEKTGANELAVEAFKQSLSLDPSSPDAKAAIERNNALIVSK